MISVEVHDDDAREGRRNKVIDTVVAIADWSGSATVPGCALYGKTTTDRGFLEYSACAKSVPYFVPWPIS